MANGALIGALRVTLGLDSAQFEAGMDKASRQTAKTEREVSGHMGKIKASMGALAAGAAGFAAGFLTAIIPAVTQAIESGLEYASSLGEVAQQLGVTSKTLQEYRYIATQTGIDQDQMDGALQRLTRTIGQAAEGGKKQAAAFATLGVSIRDANGDIRSTDDVLPDLIRAFSAIDEPTKRATLQVALFGKTGQVLDTMLHGGIDEIDRMRKAAADLHIVLSDELINNADAAADKMAQLKLVLSANIAGAVAANAREIMTLATALGDLATKALHAFSALRNAQNQKLVESPEWYGRMTRMVGGRSPGQAYNELLTNQDGRQWLFDRAEGRRRAARDRGDVSAARVAYAEVVSIKDANAAANRAAAAEAARPKRGAAGGGGGGANGGGGQRRSGGGGPRSRGAGETFELDQRLASAELTSFSAIEEMLGQGNALADGLESANERVRDSVRMTSEESQRANSALKASFVDLAQTSIGAMQNLSQSLRSGDLIDVLSSLLNAFSQLGSTGLFGKKIQLNLRAGYAGAKAMGGPVAGGRTYLVGERGPELFTPGGTGRITPNHQLGGGGAAMVFDLRGAVMTPDLVAQMSRAAAMSAGHVVADNNKAMMRASRRRLL